MAKVITVRISRVGGLNTRVLARMGSDGIAILTSGNITTAVALPFTGDRQRAARQYVTLATTSNGTVRVGRLRTKLVSKLRKHGILTVSLRGELTAVLLPFPRNAIEAELNAAKYLVL